MVFKQVLGRLSRDGQSENLTAVIELCTETSNVSRIREYFLLSFQHRMINIKLFN